MKVWGFFLFAVLMVSAGNFVHAQQVNFTCWNLLNYPDLSNLSSDTTYRHPLYRSVIQFINPDILVTEENNSSNGTLLFLNNVMNATGANYSKGIFINGPDTDNQIYFRTSLFTFVSNRAIVTDLRDINEFTLVYTATGDTLRIYAVHLKASSGPPYDAQRALEIDSLRQVTNRLAPGKNFIVCGDFNIYGSFESAYQKLLQNNPNDDGNFIDPISMTGSWNISGYSSYHTQSTRFTSFGGGASGGMDDRFDMILFSSAISQGISGISYVAGSTVPVGNDGNHFNQSINVLPNPAAPVAVLNGLYNASDHLPVSAGFIFASPSGIQESGVEEIPVTIYPNPVKETFTVDGLQLAVKKMEFYNLYGKKIFERTCNANCAKEIIDVSSLQPGFYFLIISSADQSRTLKLVKE